MPNSEVNRSSSSCSTGAGYYYSGEGGPVGTEAELFSDVAPGWTAEVAASSSQKVYLQSGHSTSTSSSTGAIYLKSLSQTWQWYFLETMRYSS